jgi:hypothetical protein
MKRPIRRSRRTPACVSTPSTAPAILRAEARIPAHSADDRAWSMATSSSASAGSSPSHAAYREAGRMTGIRLSIGAHGSLGAVVMIVKLRIVSPLAGSFQRSQSPAKANGPLSIIEMRCGRFSASTFAHS